MPDDKPTLLGSPWRRHQGGELAIVASTVVPVPGGRWTTSIRLGGINDDGTPNDQTWTVDDEAELREAWEPVRRAWVPVESASTGDISNVVAQANDALSFVAKSARAYEAALPIRTVPPAGIESILPGSDVAAAVEHPTPWKWVVRQQGTGHTEYLEDANGDVIFYIESPSEPGPSAYVRRVTELAPVLERLLREHQHAASAPDSAGGGPICPECQRDPDEPHGLTTYEPHVPCPIGWVLAELDKTKGGDRG